MIGGLRIPAAICSRVRALSAFWRLAFQRPKRRICKSIQGRSTVCRPPSRRCRSRCRTPRRKPPRLRRRAANAKGSDLDLKVAWKGAPQFPARTEEVPIQGARPDRCRLQQHQSGHVRHFGPDVEGTALRRARLGVEGVAFYDVKYILEVDFANDAVVGQGRLYSIYGPEDRRCATRLHPRQFQDL